MKYVKIIVAIVLIGILYGQLYYYNQQKIKAKTEANKVENTVTKVELTKEEKIANKNDSSMVFERYAFGINQEDFDKNILNFAENQLKQIHDITTGQSVAYMTQYYDLHEKEINDMMIYSSDDFVNMAAASELPFFSKNPEYQGMDIDPNSATIDDEYLTFDGLLNYSTGGNVEIRISIAKDATTTPNMKISPLIKEISTEEE